MQLVMTVPKMIAFGRTESYVKKNETYNPYTTDVLYDWKFQLKKYHYIFEDCYRGENPYSGVEYVFVDVHDLTIPIWQCDYIGQAFDLNFISRREIYDFLKVGRQQYLNLVDDKLFFDFEYNRDDLCYKSLYTGDFDNALQTEEIRFCGELAARQISASRFIGKKLRKS